MAVFQQVEDTGTSRCRDPRERPRAGSTCDVEGRRGRHALGIAAQAGLLHGVNGVPQELVRVLLVPEAEVPGDLCGGKRRPSDRRGSTHHPADPQPTAGLYKWWGGDKLRALTATPGSLGRDFRSDTGA